MLRDNTYFASNKYLVSRTPFASINPNRWAGRSIRSVRRRQEWTPPSGMSLISTHVSLEAFSNRTHVLGFATKSQLSQMAHRFANGPEVERRPLSPTAGTAGAAFLREAFRRLGRPGRASQSGITDLDPTTAGPEGRYELDGTIVEPKENAHTSNTSANDNQWWLNRLRSEGLTEESSSSSITVIEGVHELPTAYSPIYPAINGVPAASTISHASNIPGVSVPQEGWADVEPGDDPLTPRRFPYSGS